MIILVGASASGKTEVAKLLGRKHGIRKVVTHTTRPLRNSEVNAIDYHFVDKNTFIQLKKSDFFVETTLYNGNYYGTSRPEIADDKVLIVDPNGLKAFSELNDARIVTFFMDANETTRLHRMLYRGDSLESAKKRLANDCRDFDLTRIVKTDYLINTEKLTIEEVADQVFELYQARLKSL